jgi:hypothetical protein
MNRSLRTSRRILLLELAVLLALVAYYEVGNFTFRADKALADDNAHRLLDLEKSVGLYVEPWFQHVLGSFAPLQWLLIFVYVGPHFVLTLGFLAWSYWYRFGQYPHVRNAFATFTLLAFGVQWVLPVSPPRLLAGSGLVDTLAKDLPLNGQTPWINRLTNPFAALPSVHFGWAFLVAFLAVRLTRSPWRYAWFLYPFLIALSTFTTGNHWILDPALSLVFLGSTEGSLWLLRRVQGLRQATPPGTTAYPDAAGDAA